jgi:hypothetical protein
VGWPKLEVGRTRVWNGSHDFSADPFEFIKDVEAGKMLNNFGSPKDIDGTILEGQTGSIGQNNRMVFLANHLAEQSRLVQAYYQSRFFRQGTEIGSITATNIDYDVTSFYRSVYQEKSSWLWKSVQVEAALIEFVFGY